MHRTHQRLLRGIEGLLIGIFALLTLDVLWQVFSRYALQTASAWTEELARFCLIWLTVLGAAYLNGTGAHLRMDYWLRRLPPDRLRRRQRVIEGLMAVFALTVLVLGGGNLVYTTLRLGQTAPGLGISLGYVYAVVPLSGLLIVFFSLHHLTSSRVDRAV